MGIEYLVLPSARTIIELEYRDGVYYEGTMPISKSLTPLIHQEKIRAELELYRKERERLVEGIEKIKKSLDKKRLRLQSLDNEFSHVREQLPEEFI